MTNKYYQKHKEKPHQETRKRYQNLSEGGKKKRQIKCRERYHSFAEKEKEKIVSINEGNKKLSKEEKQNLVEYIRNYYLAHKI